MPRRTPRKPRRVLIPSRPEFSRTVVEPLAFFLAVAAFLALVIAILAVVI